MSPINPARTISGYDAVYDQGAALSLVNAGTLAGNTTAAYGAGVVASAGGGVNQPNWRHDQWLCRDWSHLTGTLALDNSGIIAANTTGVVLRTASVTNIAVLLNAGGSVTNQAGGMITGYEGIDGLTGALVIINAGVIAGNPGYYNGEGIQLSGGGTITNLSSGTISGNNGISGGGGSGVTVVNAGRHRRFPSMRLGLPAATRTA